MTNQAFSVRMITIDCLDPARLASFWSQVIECPIVADYDDFVMLDSTPVLGFQRVDQPTPGKNRIHLDIGGPDREALVARLRHLGAAEHDTHSVPGLTWTVMTDPDNNFFCVGNPDTQSASSS